MIFRIYWLVVTQFLRLLVRKIGFTSYVGPPTCIYGGGGVLIGNKVRIFPGIRIETHNKGQIIVADNVSIGQNFHIISSGSTLKIGTGTTISGNVFVTNIDHDYKLVNVPILDQTYIELETNIGSNCFIGYGAVIQAGTTLGSQCIIGSNSVVRGVFPDFSVIVGCPGKVVKRYRTELQSWEPTDAQGNFLT